MIPTKAKQVIALGRRLANPSSKTFIEGDLHQSLGRKVLVFAPDLTGRPLHVMSTSYPDMAVGFRDDTIQLGYQAALVSSYDPKPIVNQSWQAQASPEILNVVILNQVVEKCAGE